MSGNTLYYGDNLEVLREHIPDESVDLIYLDPPFNSNRNYNVIFKDESGRKSDAQIMAFGDIWHWGPTADKTYHYLTNTTYHGGRVSDHVSQLIAALVSGLGMNQMTAYLVEMAVRLVELHRVLKSTGSIYLHCDPTASHYLKLLLDAIFQPRHFHNEITWTMRGIGRRRRVTKYPTDTQTLLFYTKSSAYTFNEQTWEEFIPKPFRNGAPVLPTGYSRDEEGRVFWTSPRGDYTDESISRLEKEGRVHRTRTGNVRIKYFARETSTHIVIDRPVTNSWTDIADTLRKGKERLGWPTQKPEALLERVIRVSSNEGDTVLDPFCGCGTALIAAQRNKRRWIGIDITYLAVPVIRSRLRTTFKESVEFETINRPTEVEGARLMASSPKGREDFQWWAIDLIGATPVGGVKKSGADRGIDGKITFTEGDGSLHSILVSVKSGGVNPGMVRDLRGTIDREKADIGVFITLQEATMGMKEEADRSGSYHSDTWNRDYQRIQIITIRELLEDGKQPDLPAFRLPAYQSAPRAKVETITDALL